MRTPYSLDTCCIFPYRTKINIICIFGHDCSKLSTAQRSVQSTDMTDDHKVVNPRRSVDSIPCSLAVGPTACIQHDCIHVVQQDAVLADTDIRLIVKTTAQSVRNNNTRHIVTWKCYGKL